MITLDEMLKGRALGSLPVAHQGNLKVLWFRMNKVRTAYGKPMVPTSVYRSKEDQIRIYKEKAIKKEHPFKDGVFDINKVPMSSKHLSGCAVDIADPTGELMEWCKANETLLRQIGLWCEAGTKGWVHFQSEPFKSYQLGKTIFFWP